MKLIKIEANEICVLLDAASFVSCMSTAIETVIRTTPINGEYGSIKFNHPDKDLKKHIGTIDDDGLVTWSEL